MVEDEYSNLPSWMRKKGYAGEDKKQEQQNKLGETSEQKSISSKIDYTTQPKQDYDTLTSKQSRGTFPPFQQQQQLAYGYTERSGTDIPTLYKIFMAVALIIAVAALYFAWNANNYVQSFKSKIRAIALELGNVSDKEIDLTIKDASYKANIKKNVPLRSFFSDSFGIPVELNIPINKRLNAMTSTGIPITIDVKDTLYIKDVAKVDPNSISNSIYVQLDADLKGTAPIVGRIKLRDLYGERFENITKELAALGN